MNVMAEKTLDGEFHGILIDSDLAVHTDTLPDNGCSSLQCIGTLPFMAVELLTDDPVVHHFQHDLESYFYILVWISAHYDEGGCRDHIHDVLSLWQTSSLEDIQVRKMRFVAQPSVLYERPLTAFYKPLKTEWLQPLHAILRLVHRTWEDNMDPDLPQQPMKDIALYQEFFDVLRVNSP